MPKIFRIRKKLSCQYEIYWPHANRRANGDLPASHMKSTSQRLYKVPSKVPQFSGNRVLFPIAFAITMHVANCKSLHYTIVFIVIALASATTKPTNAEHGQVDQGIRHQNRVQLPALRCGILIHKSTNDQSRTTVRAIPWPAVIGSTQMNLILKPKKLVLPVQTTKSTRVAKLEQRKLFSQIKQ